MKTKIIALYTLALTCALIAGCGTTSPLSQKNTAAIVKPPRESDNTTQKHPEGTANNEKSEKHRVAANLTPLSAYDDEWVKNTPAGKDFSGAYTRLLILSDLAADGNGDSNTTDLPYKARPWLSRALLGKEYSINLSANITVGAFESTVPLATIGHQSNTEGEKWSRVIHHSMMNFPLFLVKADGSASVPVVRLSVNGTKSYSSRGAAAAVQVVLGVARATGQAPPVVTRLSEQSTKDAARAVDEAISKLFSNSITEEHWTDRDLRSWSTSAENKPRGVRIKFSIPSGENNWNGPLEEVGTWTITFDYPRPSIFSDWRICSTDSLPRCTKIRSDAEKNVHKEINAGQVLNYRLVNGDQGLGTIRALLSQQDWYISAQAGLANQNTASATAASFCRRVTNEITGLGLNGFDAAIVLWAVVNGMPLPAATNFAAIKDCQNSISAIDNDRK